MFLRNVNRNEELDAESLMLKGRVKEKLMLYQLYDYNSQGSELCDTNNYASVRRECAMWRQKHLVLISHLEEAQRTKDLSG